MKSQAANLLDEHWDVPSHQVTRLRARKSRYAVLIPVFNEGKRILDQMARMREIGRQVDCFLVDAPSSDGAIEQLLKTDPTLVAVLKLETRIGLSAQLRVGLAWALREGYEGIILIDGNNKDNPDAIEDFVRSLDAGFDHIQGSRFVKGGKATRNPIKRLVAIRLVHAPLISLAARHWYTDTTNGFRAYSRKFLLDENVAPFRSLFNRYELHYYLSIRAGELGYKICEIPVERAYPEDGSVPTKIGSIRGELAVFKTLMRACLHLYDPTERK